MSDPPLISEVFPAGDPVARFVVAICAAHNDIVGAAYLSGYFNSKEHPMFHFEVIAVWGLILEAMSAVSAWRSTYSEVKGFIATLPQDAREGMKEVNRRIEEFGRGRQHVARNTTFHYPAPYKAKEPCRGVDSALCKAAEVDQSTSSDAGLEYVLREQAAVPCEIEIQSAEYHKLPADERDRYDTYFTFADQSRTAVAARAFAGDLDAFNKGSIAMVNALGPFRDFVDGCLNTYLASVGVERSSLERVV